MSRIHALLITIFSLAAVGVGFTDLLPSVSHQATIISALVAAGGLIGVVTIATLHGSEVEQAKFDCDFIGAAGMMLEQSPSYGHWQEIIDRLNVIANHTVWCPLQKKNAAEARALLNEAGEGDDELSMLLRGVAA